MSDTEYDPSGTLNSSFPVGAYVLYLIFLYDFYYIFPL